MNKLALICLLLLVTATKAVSAEDLASIIKQNNQQYMALFNAGDAVGLANLYTDDAVYSMDGFSIVTGKDAIIAQIKLEMAAGPATIELTTVDLEANGTTAFETGTWLVTVVDGDNKILINGNYMVVWQQQADKKWLIYRDVINHSEPHQTK
ncbi:nuclear transport factor 2 family protein [Thalassotalea sp. HSM 43]|uniref:YybH family protein n=1 Tax=Thalassotalea sp. HSM 43 TaxID=2552945 RepID=UPI001081D5FD|nr:nuclear transport factor 2 family protein [Thalassotalea sp. HSM 43]QBY06039.1 nuclear transport factor 2 family protein [Thalassotalea sp. HSM 43]